MSRIFEGFNPGTEEHPSRCVICGTANHGRTVLASMAGTQVGNLVEAKQIHLNCLLDKLQCQESEAFGWIVYARGER